MQLWRWIHFQLLPGVRYPLHVKSVGHHLGVGNIGVFCFVAQRGDCVSRLGMDGSRDSDGSYNTDTSRRRNGNRTVGGKLSKGEERLERKRALYAVQHFDR